MFRLKSLSFNESIAFHPYPSKCTPFSNAAADMQSCMFGKNEYRWKVQEVEREELPGVGKMSSR